MIKYECTNCKVVTDAKNMPVDEEVMVVFNKKDKKFNQLYCPNCKSAGCFRILISKD